jgi:hypothetical protein
LQSLLTHLCFISDSIKSNFYPTHVFDLKLHLEIPKSCKINLEKVCFIWNRFFYLKVWKCPTWWEVLREVFKDLSGVLAVQLHGMYIIFWLKLHFLKFFNVKIMFVIMLESGLNYVLLGQRLLRQLIVKPLAYQLTRVGWKA